MMYKKYMVLFLVAIIMLAGAQYYLEGSRQIFLLARMAESGIIPIVSLPEWPFWITGSLPDFLWMLALCLIIGLIWDFNWSRQSIFWYGLALVVGLGFEFAQLFDVLPGFFDWGDVAAVLLGWVISLVFIHKVTFCNV